MALVNRIKTALDELRMQMLGLQVLLGFQFQGLFQPGYSALPAVARLVDAIGLMLMVLALTLLIAIPCQHRLLEQGESTPRLFAAAREAANIALVPIALGLSCDILVSTCSIFGLRFATLAAAGALLVALLGWYGLAYYLRTYGSRSRSIAMEKSSTPLHAKIDQMLTEARVILPGTQALLGFQLVVMLSTAFKELPQSSQYAHFAALFANVVSMVLLICPAAVHRMTFEGKDETRMHTIGSALVTAALAPLALGVALDLYVALTRLLDSTDIAAGSAAAALVFMAGFWYGVPLYLRRKVRFSH
jgi:hypothetical protein